MILYRFIIVFYLFLNPVLSNQVASPKLIYLENAWVRVAEVGNSAAYLKITNIGHLSDRLIQAQTDVCEVVELHTHIKDNNIYRMRPVKEINVPAKEAVELSEGGLHIMLLNIIKPLREKEKIKIILTFEKAGQIPIIAEVRRNKKSCCCCEG